MPSFFSRFALRMSVAERTSSRRSGLAATVPASQRVLLIVRPWVGHIADRHDRVANDGHAGLDHFLPAAVAQPELPFVRIGVAGAAESVDDDRPVVPAAADRRCAIAGPAASAATPPSRSKSADQSAYSPRKLM